MASLLDHAKFSAFIYKANESFIDQNLNDYQSSNFKKPLNRSVLLRRSRHGGILRTRRGAFGISALR